VRIRQINDGSSYVGVVVVQSQRDIGGGRGTPFVDKVLVYLNAGQVPQFCGRVCHWQLFYGDQELGFADEYWRIEINPDVVGSPMSAEQAIEDFKADLLPLLSQIPRD
jgi:hypothetical protein